jgi:hypothetical protein
VIPNRDAPIASKPLAGRLDELAEPTVSGLVIEATMPEHADRDPSHSMPGPPRTWLSDMLSNALFAVPICNRKFAVEGVFTPLILS